MKQLKTHPRALVRPYHQLNVRLLSVWSLKELASLLIICVDSEIVTMFNSIQIHSFSSI